MVTDRPVTGKCTLRPAVSDFLLKLGVVLLKQLQQSFLLDADTEIGVFEFGGGYITRPSASVLDSGGLPPHGFYLPQG